MPQFYITDRHADQRAIFNDPARFKLLVAGRRWGKTRLMIETAIRHACVNNYGRHWIVAPTREMAKDLFWDHLKARVKELRWKCKIDETGLRIVRASNMAAIKLMSGEKPDRLRGRSLHWVGLDEYDTMEPFFDEVIRPSLVDTGGGALIAGTPKGRKHMYRLFQDVPRMDGWRRWQYRTIDNPYIPVAEIEHARRQLDDRTFRQEFEADFVEYLGRAYCYHDADSHCVDRSFDPGFPVAVCLDFNLNPCVWEIGQNIAMPAVGDYTYIIDEIADRETNIWRMCATLKTRLEAILGTSGVRTHPVRFYGDYTSSKRRDVSAVASSWEIIRQQFAGYNAEYRLQPNPHIVDRVNAVNARMRSADGVVRFGYHSRCKQLKLDFEMVDMALLESEAKSSAGDLTHATDAVGYMISLEYPLLPKPSFVQHVD